MSTERKVVEIKVDDILPNRFQPRIKFDEVAINDLSASIKEHGVIQPLVVRKIGDKYEIIAGERRYKASVMAGLETVPAIITELNDKDSAEVALIENVQRQNLTPIEEAVSYKKILDMGYLTQEQLANKLGKSQSSIANKLRLLNLDDDVQDALLNGQISERHARSLLKLPRPAQQRDMLDRIIEERLTVRRTDEEIDKMLNDLFESNEFDKPEEVEEEIEHTQPLSFNFDSFDDNDNKNILDLPEEDKKEEKQEFNMPATDSTDFFGFNQNIMEKDYNSNEPIKEENHTIPTSNDFVDISKIEEQSEDLYPKEEKKDINSFLEPTLLMNDDEDEKGETNSTGFSFDEINASVDSDEPTQNDLSGQLFEPSQEPNPFENIQPVEEPVQNEEINNQSTNENTFNFNDNFEDKNVELNYDMKPGKFFNLFNDDENNNPIDANSGLDSVDNNFNSMFNNPTFDTEMNSASNGEININDVNKPEENEMLGNFGTFSFEPETKVENNELTEVVPQSLEENISDENIVEESKSNNIDLAREKVNSCIEELKKLGIDINVEELDFENKYQITININK